jgi:hypothetical protein
MAETAVLLVDEALAVFDFDAPLETPRGPTP